MTRLTRRAADDLTYRFESPIAVHRETFCEQTGEESSHDHTLTSDDYDKDLNDFMAEENIAEVYDIAREQLEFITSMNMTASGGKLITTVKAREELSDKELQELEDWITGQLADGFGEGLEQRVFDHASERIEYEYEEYDEESETTEMIRDVGYEKTDCFIKLWPPNFYIKRID